MGNNEDNQTDSSHIDIVTINDDNGSTSTPTLTKISQPDVSGDILLFGNLIKNLELSTTKKSDKVKWNGDMTKSVEKKIKSKSTKKSVVEHRSTSQDIFEEKIDKIWSAIESVRNNLTSLNKRISKDLQSVSWILAEFRHNKIVQFPRENCFNVCRQLQRKVRSRKHDV